MARGSAEDLQERLVSKSANRDGPANSLGKGIFKAWARAKVAWECISVGVSIFANHWGMDTAAMYDRASILTRNLAALAESRRQNRRPSPLSADRTLQALVADLMAARTAVCMTQEDVAARMGTTKSVVSRLESGVRSRPTLRTIERYALAVGASVEIRVRKHR